MPRLLRFIPEGGALVEVTTRTFQGRLLLTPRPLLNRIIIGALARASRRHGVRVVAVTCVSNHYHTLLWVDDAEQLATCMNVFNAKVAREVGRLTGWRDKIWSRRYQAIVISHEEAAQVERLTYVLAHSVKENLVARVEEWPGVHAGPALIAGKPMEGVWYDRSREYLARMKGDDAGPEQFAEPEVLSFVQLPCWEHLTPERYRAQIAVLIQKIAADAAAERARTGRQPLGPEAIRKQNPTSQPNHVKKSPAPRFHAFAKRVRRELYEAYSWFVAAFRDAAEKLRGGDLGAQFPVGSFPPHLPFVREIPAALSPTG